MLHPCTADSRGVPGRACGRDVIGTAETLGDRSARWFA